MKADEAKNISKKNLPDVDIKEHIKHVDRRIAKAIKKGLRRVKRPDLKRFWWLTFYSTRIKDRELEALKKHYVSKGYTWGEGIEYGLSYADVSYILLEW